MMTAADNSARAQARALGRLAAPIAATQAGFALMGIVDAAVVGRLGALPLAAVGLANGLYFAVSVIGIGLMMGLDPLVAQAVGKGDRGRARELLWQGLWLALIVTAVLAVPCALLPLTLVPAGIAPATARLATVCLWLRIPGFLPMMVYAGLRAFLQAQGKVRPLVMTMAIANVCNLGLDVLFVYGGAGIPALGAPGTSIATSLCSAIQVGLLFFAVHGLREPGEPEARRLPLLRDLRTAARIGLPVGLQMAAEVSVFALAGVLAGRFGDLALAAHQIAISLASLTFCVAVGIGNAGSVLVGWAIGARDTPAARRAGLLAFGAGAGFMSLCACAFWLAPAAFARLISDQEPVVAAAVPLLAVAAFFQISDGVQGVGAGVLRGAGDTRYAFFANVIGHYGVGLPIALLLGFHYRRGVVGLWWGLCAGLTAVALALFVRFWLRSSRHIEPIESSAAAH